LDALRVLLVAALVAGGWASAWGAGTTLDRVRAAGELVCGVNVEVGDYSRSDDHGAREAFDKDLCRAVGVAILGPSAKVAVKKFPDDVASVAALRAGTVDLLPSATLDFTHTTQSGVGFSGVMLWDGVGFLVPIGSGVQRAEDLSGKKICLLAETEVEESVRASFLRKGLKYVPFPYQEEGEMEAGFVTGGCAAIAGDLTRLAMTRMGFGELGPKYRVLGDVISKDPLAMAYRRETDGGFGEIVDWVREVLVGAEEMGIGSATVRAQGGRAEWDTEVRRMVGKTHDLGARLGLRDGWAVDVIGAVGNYGEVYERGLGSGMGLARGRNRTVEEGGWMVGMALK
jgi:general L-amino acid transport system substrate-binding protein